MKFLNTLLGEFLIADNKVWYIHFDDFFLMIMISINA